MTYETYAPHADLASVVKCHWILEVQGGAEAPKQRVLPDGCIEMYFILGEDVKRFTSETNFIIQPRAMVYGQITEPYFVQPTGAVNTFAVRFYPYSFAHFVSTPILELADKETTLSDLFGEAVAQSLETKIIEAANTKARIEIIEQFLLDRLHQPSVIDQIVKSTVEVLTQTKGNASINTILKGDLSKRRNLERNFAKQVGISPKQLGRIIRLQTALKLLLNKTDENLTQIAYESDYYDQAHFIKDFKSFTGTNPREYLTDEQMQLSSLIYSKE